MSQSSPSLINMSFAFSIISLGFNLTLLILKIALGFTGFQTHSAHNCSLSPYLELRLASADLSQRVNTFLVSLALALSLIVSFILLKIWRDSKTQKEDECRGGETQLGKSPWQVYLLTSFQTLCLLIIGGRSVSLLIDNRSCQIVNSSTWTIVLVVAMTALLVALTLLVLIIIWSRLLEQQQESLQKDGVLQNQEIKLLEHFDLQAKQYIGSNGLNRNGIMQSLLQNEERIFDQAEKMENTKEKNCDKETHNDRISSSDRSQNSKKQEEQKQENQQVNKQEQLQQLQQLRTGSQDQQAANARKAQKEKKTIETMHSYYLNTASQGCEQAKRQQPDYQKMMAQQQQQWRVQRQANEKSQLQNTLLVKDEDNLSQKFDQNNFQLEANLNEAIQMDQENDLSPMQNKEVFQFSEMQFKLIHNNRNSLQLQKKYNVLTNDKISKYVIRINFIKIKNYKINELKNQIKTCQQNKHNDDQNKSAEINESNKIMTKRVQNQLSDEMRKLLNSRLKNSSFLKRNNSREQTECPLSKYIEKEQQQNFKNATSNYFNGKNKKYPFAEEELVFQKKKEKQSIINQFNDDAEIQHLRNQLFGAKQDSQQHHKRETQKIEQKKHWRKLLKIIRSKFNT